MTDVSVLIYGNPADGLDRSLESVKCAAGSLVVETLVIGETGSSTHEGRYLSARDRALGCRRARGEWVAFLRAGDTWPAGRLPSLLRGSEPAHSDVLYSDVRLSWGAAGTSRTWGEFVRTPDVEQLGTAVVESDCIAPSSLLLRRGVLLRATDAVVCEPVWEVELILRLLQLGARFERRETGLPTVLVPKVFTNAARLEYMLGIANVSRGDAVRALGLSQVGLRRARQAIVESLIFSRYQDLTRRKRAVVLSLPEVRRSAKSLGAQLAAVVAPEVFGRVQRGLKDSRPLTARTLDILGRQSLHDCSLRATSLCRSEPLISIVIPCYNYGRFLEEAVRSALEQAYSNVEILVIDDGSTDETPEVCRGLPESVRYVRQSNIGLAATRNKAKGLVSGEFVTFLDADNRLHPLFLTELLGKFCDFEGDPGYAFTYSQLRVFGREERITTYPRFDRRKLTSGNYIDACSLLRSKSIQDTMYSSTLPCFEDWDFYLLLVEKGCHGDLVDLPLLEYRKHDSRVSMLDVMSDKRTARKLTLTVQERHLGLLPFRRRLLIRALRAASSSTRRDVAG